jgi:hypothetical protein
VVTSPAPVPSGRTIPDEPLDSSVLGLGLILPNVRSPSPSLLGLLRPLPLERRRLSVDDLIRPGPGAGEGPGVPFVVAKVRVGPLATSLQPEGPGVGGRKTTSTSLRSEGPRMMGGRRCWIGMTCDRGFEFGPSVVSIVRVWEWGCGSSSRCDGVRCGDGRAYVLYSKQRHGRDHG